MKNILTLTIILGYVGLWGQTTDVSPLKFNSKYDEFSPFVLGDQLLFCSNRKPDLLQTVVDSKGKYLHSIYSTPLSNLTKSNVVLFSENISSLMHEGPLCYDEAAGRIYFTSNLVHDPKQKGLNSLGIFYSDRQEEGWGEPAAFEFNSPNGEWDVAHPAISPDGKHLIFSSNEMEGHADLYVCERKGNSWSQPTRLKGEISSRESELFPSFDEQGILYFSSNREMGTGLDIYKSMSWNQEEPKAEKLAAPLNSEHDDFGVYTINGTEGYFSSNRSGNDDLFSFTTTFPKFEDCNEVIDPFLCYLIEEEQIVPNDTLPLIYVWDYGDGTTGDGLSNIHCFSGVGEYNVVLNILDTITGTQYAQVSQLELVIDYPTQPFITGPDTLAMGSEGQYTPEGTFLPGVEIIGHYWNYGPSYNLRADGLTCSFPDPGVWRITMGIMARTEYGDTLKVCAYRDVVVVDPDLVVFDQEPLAVEQPEQSEYTEEVPRTLTNDMDSALYFVQFKESNEQMGLDDPYFNKVAHEITERFDEDDSTYSYTVGEADHIFKLYGLYREMIDSGYTNSVVLEREMEEFRREIIRRGSYVADSIKAAIHREINRFSNINFGNSKFDIRPESFDNLDYVIHVLEREPKMRLKIHAHTDNIGGVEFNEALSDNRALSVLSYLVERGIAENRLEWEGHGSNSPIEENDTDYGRSKNRRVEFEILFEEVIKD